MNKRILLLVLTINLSSLYGYSQRSQVVPPSPTMATLQRFGDYPVSYATGLPQINIPLYNIKLKDFSYPVSMDFHASGRVGGMNYSPLGIGWALTASGYISREIRGRPDNRYLSLEITADGFNHLYTNLDSLYDRLLLSDTEIPNGITGNNGGYFGTSEQDKEDDQHDIYSFGVNGISGKFIITQNGIVQLTYTGLTITVSGNLDGFTITDGKGTSYYFGTVPGPGTSHYGAIETSNVAQLGTSGTYYPENIGWYLARANTPGGAINFTYNTRPTDDPDHPDDAIAGNTVVSNEVTDGYGPYCYFSGDVNTLPSFSDYNYNVKGGHSNTHTITTNYTIAYLTNISFAGGSIAFNYETDTTLQLRSCIVKNSSDYQIKKMNFSYINAPGSTTHLYNNNSVVLHTLTSKGTDSSQPEIYSFDYIPGDVSDPYSTDWWGYLMGGGNMPPIDATDSRYSEVSFYTCTGCKAATGTKNAGMLSKITYPTGGNTQFYYEDNKYKEAGTNAMLSGPGLRVDSIVTNDGSGTNKVTRIFKYGELVSGVESGLGILAYQPHASDFWTEKQIVLLDSSMPTGYGYYTVRTYKSNPSDGMIDAYRQPIYYSRVAEYIKAQDASKNGLIVYGFTTPPETYAVLSIPKTFRMNYWMGGKQELKSVYKYRPTQNDYVLVESKNAHYETFHNATVPQVLVWRSMSLPYEDNAGDDRSLERFTWGSNVFSVVDFPFESGVELPTIESHATFNSLGTADVHTITYNTYNNNSLHIQPIHSSTVTSRGDSLVTETKFTGDLITPLTNSIFPAEISTYRIDAGGSNKRLISSTHTIWDEPIPTHIYAIESATPLTTFTPAYLSGTSIIKDSHFIEKQVFDQYNGVNLLETHTSSNPHVCYVWGYGGQYPIAKIENANYIDVLAVLGSGNITTYNNNPEPPAAELNTFLAPLRTDSRLSGAQVTTYTYQPLVGMTSMTDPKGEITYYQYDSGNRLSLILDHNASVVKAFCYNYQGQLSGCPINQIVYAKLSLTNQATSPPDTNDNPDYYTEETWTYADVAVNFYTDYACTIPKSISAGLTVTVNISESEWGTTGTNSYTTTANYTVPANINSLALGNFLIEYDKFTEDHYSGADTYFTQYFEYNTATHSGSNYTPRPTF